MSIKPLGRKAYGSIPHLPSSRTGPGDYVCEAGQAAIATGGKEDRLQKGKKDRVIVTEKLDGSNVAIANVDGERVALGRSGYLARTSPHYQHQVFDAWTRKIAGRLKILPEGWRVSGEWLHQAHGTIYKPEFPFIVFDVFDAENDRLLHDDMTAMAKAMGLPTARVLSDGPALSVAEALLALGPVGFHGAQELPEGAVWRVETNGAFSFMVKYVRPGKVDGKYFEAGKNGQPLYMCDPMGMVDAWEGGEA